MSFNVGNNILNFLSSTGVVASYPFAVAVRFHPTVDSVDQTIWSSGADGTHYMALTLGSDNLLRFYVKDGGSDSAADTGFFTYSADQDYFVLILALSATDRRIYPFGVDLDSFSPGMGRDTVNLAMSAYTESFIGKGAGVSWNGTISEVCVWKDFPGNPFDPATSQSMNGVSPLFFAHLLPYVVSYSRLLLDSNAYIGESYTENGTVTFASHPRVWWPSPSFGFSGVTAPEGNHFTGEATDTVAFTEHIKVPILVEDTISLDEIIFNSAFQYVTDTISLTESIGLPPRRTDHMSLTETIVTTTSREREYEDSIGLFETIQVFLNADCPTCCDPDEQYHPYIGTSSAPNLPTPPSATPPTLTPSHSIVLSHPYVSPTLTVTLRAPEFGNKDQVENKRVRRPSRGGTIQIFADPQWPKIYRLQMDFAALSEQLAQDYATFRRQTLGKEIKLVDHESRVWKGVLTEVGTPVNRNRRNGVQVSLSFEGELQ